MLFAAGREFSASVIHVVLLTAAVEQRDPLQATATLLHTLIFAVTRGLAAPDRTCRKSSEVAPSPAGKLCRTPRAQPSFGIPNRSKTTPAREYTAPGITTHS